MAAAAAENCEALSESRNNRGLRFREEKRNLISSSSLSLKERKTRERAACAKGKGRENGGQGEDR